MQYLCRRTGGRKQSIQIFSQFRTYSYQLLTASSDITKFDPLHGVTYYQFCLQHRVPSKQISLPRDQLPVLICNNQSYQLKLNLLTAGIFFSIINFLKEIGMLFE